MESLLHSGLDIQFVLSMVYWLSFIQIYQPGGFVYFVDKFELETAKFEPEIISYTTIYGSNQIGATSVQWIRVQSFMDKLPKFSPHQLRRDGVSFYACSMSFLYTGLPTSKDSCAGYLICHCGKASSTASHNHNSLPGELRVANR